MRERPVADGCLVLHRAEHAHQGHSRAAYSGGRTLLHRLAETLDPRGVEKISLAAAWLDPVSGGSGALVPGDRAALSGIPEGSFFQRADRLGAEPEIASGQ